MLRDRHLSPRSTNTFTLQWHLTDACEYRCRHCYVDRQGSSLSATEAGNVLDQLDAFCLGHRVISHLCLSGGDPLLYPHFFDVYAKAARSVHRIGILGNPTSEEMLARIVAIRTPNYYQVSLEGLEPHNDSIRGQGHYGRTLEFLSLLQKHRVCGHVMLTLTRDNCSQVLSLAERLRPLATRFSFNRLAQVGHGSALAPVEAPQLRELFERYVSKWQRDRLLRPKDNLLVPLWLQHYGQSFGGCTGQGCGAAFNFLALLASGELHACRKFPSRVGHVLADGLQASYRSRAARAFRQGSAGCRRCELRSKCGGCMAVTNGRSLDPLRERDPDCWVPLSRQPAFVAGLRAHLIRSARSSFPINPLGQPSDSELQKRDNPMTCHQGTQLQRRSPTEPSNTSLGRVKDKRGKCP